MNAAASKHPPREFLQAFGLGKLDDATATKVSLHLDTCDDCKRQVAELSSDSLLDHLRKANGPVSTPAPGRTLAPLAPAAPPQAATLPPTGVPAELLNNVQYDIMRELGAGGMGVVYLAKNKLMDRLEVLKVIGTAMIHKSGALERFLREIRSAAALSHDNVVKAYSASQFGELLVFAMEYVEGEDLSKVVKTHGPLPIANACFYARQVALGLQHAHEKNMVHRDIKPHNLILARDGKKHVVKILDFGLAKATSEKVERGLTGEGRMLGTPDYMAPEQIQDAASADIRADIYSLGCTLYYLLTGATPFNASSLYGLLQAHQTQEARSVNLVRPEVPMELGAIVAKMMAKDPKKRFQKPIEVAQAMAPFIVKAGIKGIAPAPALSLSEVLQAKLARPDPAPKHVETLAPILLATPVPHATMIAANPFSWPPDAEEPKPTPKTPKVGTPRWVKPMLLAAVAVGMVFLGLLTTLVAGIIFRVESNDGTLIIKSDDPNAVVKVTAEGGATLTYGRDHREIQLKPGKYGLELADAKGGLKLSATQITLTTGDKKTIEISWEKKLDAPGKIAEGLGPKNPSIQPKQRLPSPSAALEALRRDKIPPEALKLAGDGDSNNAPASLVGVLGEVQPFHTEAVLGLAYSPDSRWLATGSADKTIMLRDAGTGEVKRILKGHTGAVSAVVFSKDGKSLLSASLDGTVKVWSVDKEVEPKTLRPELGQILAMAGSPDGRFLAAGGAERPIKLWKWGEWDKSTELQLLKGRVTSLTFSPDGSILASSWAGAVRLYQTADGKTTQTWPADGSNRILAFHRDGKRLVSAGGLVKIWDVASGKQLSQTRPGAEPEPYNLLALHPDGEIVYACNGGGLLGQMLELTTWNYISGKGPKVFREPQGICSAVYSPNGDYLAFGTNNGGAYVWDFAKGEKQLAKQGHSHYVHTLSVSPDGRMVLSGGDDNAVRRWDVARPRENKLMDMPEFPLNDVAFPLNHVAYSADGKKYVSSSSFWDDTRNMGIVWDAITSKRLFVVNPTVKAFDIVFSPDGKTVAACGTRGADDCIVLWDANTGKQVHRFPRMGVCLDRPAFSRDGKLVAAATTDTKCVKVWDVASGEAVASWTDNKPMCTVALSPDGRLIAAGHHDGAISLWDVAEQGKKKRAWEGHSGSITRLMFTADGNTLVSSSVDGTIRLWNPAQQRAREIISIGPANRPLTFDLDPSGKYLFAAGHCPLIFVVRLPEPAAGEPGKIAGDSSPKSLDPDRKAAEYVLSIGGVVRVNDEVDDTRTVDELPKAPFRLTYVYLPQNPKLRNAGLAAFDGCKNVTVLNLHETQVKDVGLAYFKDCKNLTDLQLGGTGVTDLGLAYLNGCTKVQYIGLNYTKVTDVGLAYFNGCENLKRVNLFAVGGVNGDWLARFKDCSKLEELELDYTKFNDAGLAHLQSCKNLVSIGLLGTQVTDEGLAYLKDCKNLKGLGLGETKVTNVGLAHFKGLKKLIHLRLHATQITDKGLAYFKGCENLELLEQRGSKVTKAGLDDFRKALPKCRIDIQPGQ